MSDNTEYKNIFETILTRYSWWSRLQGSQFVEMIATFVGQMVYKANAVSVRSLQEAFLSTATKRSSILASAEDKGYIGRKIMPSTGTSEVENLTNAVMSLPRSTPLISNAAIEYVTMAAVEIPPFGKIEIPVSQLVLKVLKTTVDQEDKFLEPRRTKLTFWYQRLLVVMTYGKRAICLDELARVTRRTPSFTNLLTS
jgi:hypothetical protein